jgi:hypothetical protein
MAAEESNDIMMRVPDARRRAGQALPRAASWRMGKPMWTDPYLETCCRSALHRLVLAGPAGRPAGLVDAPCLRRLAERGLAEAASDGRFQATALGLARHDSEILHLPSPG